MADDLDPALAARAPAAARPYSRARSVLWPVVGLFVFVLAIQLLKQGAGGLALVMRGLTVHGFSGTLGFGWLMAYVALSGSPVAAVSLTLLGGGAIGPMETFAMINGSRLGASFIVLLTGFVYYLRGWRGRGVVSMGVLAMLTTATIYLPAMALGIRVLSSGALTGVRFEVPGRLTSAIDLIYDPIVGAAAARLPALGIFAVGFVTLLAAFRIFDRALPHVETGQLRAGRWGPWLEHPASMFLLGMIVTTFTLSVSVSLSVLVPLAARGMVRREPVIPYIMGANITTFVDTLFASLLVRDPMAFTVVLTEMLSVAAVSVVVLFLAYRPYKQVLLALNRLITATRVAFAVFVAILAAVPLYLMVR